MRHGRSALALLIVVLLTGLAPVAFADPPDPTWIGGYWDDDDFDNVVAFIASNCAALVEGAVHDGPVLAPVAPIEPIEPYARPVVHRPSAPSRAPPVSLLSDC